MEDKIILCVKHSEWGIACRIGDTIYINPKLKAYPKLYRRILKHERSHSSNFTLADITQDLSVKELKGIKYQFYSFLFTHPKSWVEFLPCWKYNGKWAFNLMIIIMYLIFGLGGLLFLIIK